MFRVVPDQLRISEGWVRCGQCDEVFDANAHLRSQDETQSLAPVDVPPVVDTELPASLPAAAQAAPEPDPEPVAVVPEVAEAPVAEPTPLNLPPPYSAADTTEPYDWGPVLSTSNAASMPEITLDVGAPVVDAAPAYIPETDPFLEHSPQDSLAASSAPMDDWVAHHEQEITALRHSEALEEQAAAAVSFGAEEVAPSFMAPDAAAGARRGPGRAILWSLCTLLLLLLGMQLLMSERDRLAATAPALRPLLAGTCQLVGCTIAAPRQIEAIAIDSSAFTSVKPGVYLLKVTLKNAAAIDLATPALELTLTDTQDQPLLRRIVLPAEFNGTLPIAAGAEMATSLPVSVRPGAVSEKISGYKLLAFYP
jgi:predicted Zn finger-like uncharacterized protein